MTTTGTVRLAFDVVDGRPFAFLPGQFVGIESRFEDLGYRHSPYCILSPPDGEPRFEVLVRIVPEGPLSQHLARRGRGGLPGPDLGVVQKYIYKEPYFDAIHEPHPEVVAAIRERFVATDLFSAYAARRGSQFDIDRDLEAARTGRAGNGDQLAVSDLFDLLPAFLSHHPDQEEPAPTHVEHPWNRPY